MIGRAIQNIHTPPGQPQPSVGRPAGAGERGPHKGTTIPADGNSTAVAPVPMAKFVLSSPKSGSRRSIRGAHTDCS